MKFENAKFEIQLFATEDIMTASATEPEFTMPEDMTDIM